MLGNPRDERTIGRSLSGGDVKLTINIHHCEFDFITFTFSVIVGVSVHFNVKSPPSLHLIRMLSCESGLPEGGVVSFEKGDYLLIIETIKARGKEKSAESWTML